MDAVSPTLELARQRVVFRRAAPAPARRVELNGAVAAALAVGISLPAAGALVVGIAWTASTLRGQLPADSMPYALAWSGASLVTLVTSVGSLFLPARRATLLATAAVVAAAMVVGAVTANTL
ncbi:MAG TPA: hypothetical protein VK920_02500 [Solirubrobacterales bacterium]|nr:hypothetical protein [Solirubrobacterales bacterium]